MSRLRVSLALLVQLAAGAASSRAEVVIDLATDPSAWLAWGAAVRNRSGSFSGLGDVNGDGHVDLVFTEPGWSTEQGRVLVSFGPVVLPSAIDLAVDGVSLEIQGDSPGDRIGETVVVADLNGDGIDDVLVGAAIDGPAGGRSLAGAVAIFLGRLGWTASLRWSDADWVFHGADVNDFLLHAVVGDLNGDGAPDLVLISQVADGPGNVRTEAGEAYLFWGPAASWPKRAFDLAVDVPNVHMYGADGDDDNLWSADQLAWRYQIIDVMGDGTPDLILGMPGGSGPGNTRPAAGEVYVLAGKPTWPSVIDFRTEAPDFLVYGTWIPGDNFSGSGLSTVTTGDWDGDGEVDLILGAWTHNDPGPPAKSAVGAIHVLRGRSRFSGVWDLQTQPADAIFIGPRASSFMGYWLGFGDINGDGYSDIASGSFDDYTLWDRAAAGATLVIAGCGSPATSRRLDIDPPDIAVYGGARTDWWGGQFSLHDFDGDGRLDIFSGAKGSDGAAAARRDSGETRIVLGVATTTVCTVAAAAGPGADVCGVVDVPLDGRGSVVVGCREAPQYRWMKGSKAVRDWSTDPTVIVRAAETTLYRLEVRCGDCAGPCFGSSEVAVTVDPDIVPPDLGNKLRAVKDGSEVWMTWTGDLEARTYSLYRGTDKGVWPPPIDAGLTVTEHRRPDVPGPGPRYYYRITGASCSGREGP